MKGLICFFDPSFDFNVQAFPDAHFALFDGLGLFLHQHFHFLQLHPSFKLNNSLP